MTRLRRLWPITGLLLLLGFLGGGGAAQDDPIDPWQYPVLVKSKPFQRWYYQFQQRAFPLADIPAGANYRALEEINRVRELERMTLGDVSPQAETWVSIGPGQIVSGPWSGRVADIVADPTNPDHWLIGAAQGGIWETRDAGANWFARTDTQPSLAMGAITFAPGNPNIVYAGSGEASFSASSFGGAGVMKSTDSGQTWTALNPTLFEKATFSDIRVDPANSNILVAATSFGVAGRDGRLPPVLPPSGLIKSTDGGVTWIVNRTGRATDLEVHPADFRNQYGCIGNSAGGSTNGLYRSTDAGDTWARIGAPFDNLPAGAGRIEVALAPSNPNIAYVSVQDANNGNGSDSRLLGVWRTANAWDTTPTFTQLTSPTDGAIANESQWWYDHDLTVEPSNDDVIYIGGVNLRKFDGTTWRVITGTIHPDQQCMAWAGTRLLVGNDGGVWSTTDGGNTFASHNTNLTITQFYDGSVHPSNPNFVIGGSQDNGTEMWTGSPAWLRVFGGDGADSVISLTRPDDNWIVSFQNLSLRRTTNSGATFLTADSGIDKTGAPFISRVEKCPSNDDLVLAGTDNLWRCSDFFGAGSPTWSANGPEMRSASGNSVGITAIAFAPSDPSGSTYAFGTSDGQLRITTNGGTTWTDLDSGNSIPNRYVTDLAFDANDATLLYVAISGFDEGTPGQPGHLFKTTSALSSSPAWINVSPPANIPNNTVALDSFAPGTVFVGADLGVFKSTDGGTSWVHQGPESGMPNVAVFDLQVNNATGQLVAFTHGRGAFLNTSVTKVDPAPLLTNATLSLGGQDVPTANAGQAGLRITVNGSGFRQDTRILINGVVTTAQVPSDPDLATRRRIIELDQNTSIRDNAGSLFVQARQSSPSSGSSNAINAGRLTGTEITRIKVKVKGVGFLLKVIGTGFQQGSTAVVLDQAGAQIPVASVDTADAPELVRVRITEGAPPAGTLMRVRIINPTGVRSNEATAVAP